MPLKYLDHVNGNDAWDGLTPATPKKSHSAVTVSAGDKVKIKASPAPVAVAGMGLSYWGDLQKSIEVSFGTDFTSGFVGTSRAADLFNGTPGDLLATRTNWASNSGNGTANNTALVTDENRIRIISNKSTCYRTDSLAVNSIIRGNYHVKSLDNAQFPGLFVRMPSTTIQTMYSLSYEVETRTWVIKYLNAALAPTVLGSCVMPTQVTIGQNIKAELRVIGNKLQALINDVPIITTFHTGITASGYCGVNSGGVGAIPATNNQGIHLSDIEVFNVHADATNTSTNTPVKMIDDGLTSWTAASASYSAALFTGSYKKPGPSTPIINHSVAGLTGKMGYRTAPAPLDLSAYQQVSLWARVNGATSTAGQYTLRLCSDTTGDTVVHSIPLPVLATNRWTLVTTDFGTNLSSNISSLSVHVTNSPGGSGIMFDHIVACKNTPDALSLTSLIGKGTAGETYYGIQSITNISKTGCTITLDNQTETLGGGGRGYSAQSEALHETLPLWKREPISLTSAGIGLIGISSNQLFAIGSSGTSESNLAEYEYGYSDLSLGAPDSETWFDFQNGNGRVLAINGGVRFTKISKVSAVRANQLMALSGTVARNHTVLLGSANNMTTGAILMSASTARSVVSVDYANNNGGQALDATGANGQNVFYARQLNNNLNNALAFITKGDKFLGGYDGSRTQIANNANRAIRFDGSGVVVKRILTRSNTTSAFQNNSSMPFGEGNFIEDAICQNEAAIFAAVNDTDSILYLRKFGGVEGDNRLYISNATAFHEAGIWRVNLSSATLRTSATPAEISLGRIACVAHRTVTVKAHMKRDHAAVGCALVAPAHQLAGVPTEVVSSVAGVGSFEWVTIAFTPTESSFIDLFWRASTTVAETNALLKSIQLSGAAFSHELGALAITDRGAIMAPNIAAASGAGIFSSGVFK